VMVNGRSCQELFNNGVCDSECCTTECLLDGKDCLPTCPHWSVMCVLLIIMINCDLQLFLRLYETCANRFQNQRCNQRCNTQECLFDGGDCKSPSEVKLV